VFYSGNTKVKAAICKHIWLKNLYNKKFKLDIIFRHFITMIKDTFNLTKGTVEIDENKISISGDEINKRWRLNLFVAIGWSAFFLLQGFTNYRHFEKSHDRFDLLFSIFCFFAFIGWTIKGGYFRTYKFSTQNEIAIDKIKTIKQSIRFKDGIPLVQIFLVDNKVRTLEFVSPEDLRFEEAITKKMKLYN
jgi:hypothetical protein